MSALRTHASLGPGISIDVDRLIVSRLLLQANSGAGKSWAIRRLLEQTHGQLQHLVIDVEGEFFTLREKYDYVLAGAGGDCPAEPRSAKLLAHRLLELGVSAIIDIYELKAHERQAFVKSFLDALVNAPRKLWHPALIVVDEAHVFAPQSGKAESTGAVIDLMTRGRKRGYCGVLATQRLSKLHKDAAAETNNKLIGRSSLDVDMKRAAEELGFTTAEQKQSLRTLKPGEFFAFGPAFADVVTRVKVGAVQTTHPKAGQSAMTAPAPRAKVRKVLSQLADLPAEAEAEIRDLADAKRAIAGLKRELTLERKKGPAPEIVEKTVHVEVEKIVRVEVPVFGARELAHIEKIDAHLKALRETGVEVFGRMDRILQLRDKVKDLMAAPAPRPAPERAATPRRPPPPPALRPPRESAQPVSGSDLPPRLQRILDAIASLEIFGIPQPSRPQVAAFAHTTHTTSTFEKDLGALRNGGGFIAYPAGGLVALTEAGRKLSQAGGEVTVESFQGKVLRLLAPRRQRILDALIDAYPEPMSREDLAAAAGTTPTTSTFEKDLGNLRKSMSWIGYPRPGYVVARPVLFLEDAK